MMNVIKHTATEYDSSLPKMLATIDAICFDTDKMQEEEWTAFFDKHKSWLVVWYELENRPIAAAVMCWSSHAQIAYLDSSAVLPEYQKQGLGQLLLDDRLSYAFDIATVIQAHTRTDNTAVIKLLSKNNFKPIQYVPDFYGSEEDGILWSLRTGCRG